MQELTFYSSKAESLGHWEYITSFIHRSTAMDISGAKEALEKTMKELRMFINKQDAWVIDKYVYTLIYLSFKG